MVSKEYRYNNRKLSDNESETSSIAELVKAPNNSSKKIKIEESSSLSETSSVEHTSEEKANLNEAVEELEVSDDSEETQSQEEKAISEDDGEVSEETQSGSNNEEVDDATMRTVFIKGLDYDTKEKDIREQMEKFGQIVRVHLPMTHDDRRNKGFVYVEFRKLIDAQKAMKLHDTTFLGRKIIVDRAQPKTNHKIFTVFVKNLGFDTKKEELLEYFNKFGKVYNLSLPVDTEHDNRNRGFCFVEYIDEELANKVVAGKHILNKRNLYLNLGNKNEERNEKRSSDRLYGRKDGNDRSERGDRPERGGKSYDRPERGSRSGDRPERGGKSYDRPERSSRSGDRPERGGKSFDRKDSRNGSAKSNKKTFDDSE